MNCIKRGQSGREGEREGGGMEYVVFCLGQSNPYLDHLRVMYSYPYRCPKIQVLSRTPFISTLQGSGDYT